MIVNYRHLIKELFKEIDVSDYDYEKAITRYNSISKYVESTNLSSYQPNVFVQGSFKLGTAIKPITEDGSYDIDIVLTLKHFSKSTITQKKLKELVGKVVENYANENNMNNPPKDGKRCWTLEYVDNHNFHVDILPTIHGNVGNELNFTDKSNPGYSYITNDWHVTNPQDYYDWFINISNYSDYARRYAQDLKVQVESIPYYKIKTPLQRVIQIFKRHAEVMYEDNLEFKPSSIIITTLCAKAYKKINLFEIRFEDLLKKIAVGMMNELDYNGERYCVLNPTYNKEDLSVKWNDSTYFDAFKKWINQLKFDLSVDSPFKKTDEEYNLLKRSLFKCTTPASLKDNVNLLPYHKEMSWNNQIWKEVEIKAYICDDNYRKIKSIHSGEKLQKNINLRFEVFTEHISLYDVYWQVTNTGFEAQIADQLRGDFYNSEPQYGERTRVESTCYTGKHYVEAFVVDKNNNCVGRSYPFEVNII